MAIPDVLKSVHDIEAIIIDIIAVVAARDYKKIFGLASHLMTLVKDLKAALPEIKSMSPEDAKALLEALMEAFQAIVTSLK